MPTVVEGQPPTEQGPDSAPPPFPEAQIRRLVGDASFKKGRKYFESGAIYDTRREGRRLLARCAGQSEDFYRVSAELRPKGDPLLRCDCYVGPYCKHTAALLLTYLNAPERFQVLEPLESRLAACSQEDLVSWLVELADRDPDTAEWLQLRISGAGTAANLDPELILRQVEDILETAAWDDDAFEIADHLREIVRTAARFASKGRREEAATTLSTTVLGIVHQPRLDEDAPILEVLDECLDQFNSLLSEDVPAADSARRILWRAITLALMVDATWIAPVSWINLIQARATAEERRVIAAELEVLISAAGFEDASRAILLQIDPPADDEEYLRRCAATGAVNLAFEKLLALGRYDEALEGVPHLFANEILSYAERLVRAGDEAGARTLLGLYYRAHGRNDVVVRDRLRRLHRAAEDWAEVLELCRDEFLDLPNLAAFQEAACCGERLGNWQATRAELLGEVEPRTLLHVQILLFEGAYAEAADVARDAGGWEAARLRREVIDATELAAPEIAIELLRSQIEGQIKSNSYRAACELLERTRKLHLQQDDPSGWAHFREDLRQRYRTRKAFIRQFERADL